MSNIKLYVANASNTFTDDDIKIFENAAQEAEKFIHKYFDFDYQLDLIISEASFFMPTISEDGIGGRTYQSRLIIINIDKNQKEISQDFVYETICHEMSHSLRWEKLPEYSETLVDAMVFEGLAVVLEEKALADQGRTPKQFFLKQVQDTPQSEIDDIYRALEPKFGYGYEEYDYHKVFFDGDDALPRWAGYKLGYYLVKEYLKDSGQTIEEATLASYKNFAPKTVKKAA
ncbi:hypothetical protein CR969_02360 [Candidatus Saccharibacteria bacterium]|nr:MAG: hypothetical protein CR969_02360 [Candidatus Saccharibacteria bacterium]